MKAYQLILGTAFAVLAIAPLGAQSITPKPGYTTSELFRTNPGETIAGLDADSSHLYYLLQRASGTTLLVRRDVADGYATPTTLFDLSAPVFGSFVRFNSGKVFFGESSGGVIRTFDPGTSLVAPLATVDGNYDIAFGGGFGWLSANPGFAGNKIMRLDLTTGAATTVLTSSDFSGPVAFDAGGSLYYGATAFGAGGDIFRYPMADLASGGLVLDGAHKWTDNAGNAFFDSDGSMLLQTDFSALSSYSFGSASATVMAATANSFGSIAMENGTAFATVTDYGGAPFSDDRSAVFAVVPEPATTLLAGLGITLVALRRRRA
jgi:PEP-CTERM motif